MVQPQEMEAGSGATVCHRVRLDLLLGILLRLMGARCLSSPIVIGDVVA